MDKLLQLEAKLAYLEAERARLLARLAALERRSSVRTVVLYRHLTPERRAALERLHGLLSAVWLELQEQPQAPVHQVDDPLSGQGPRAPVHQEIEEALRILEELLA